MPRCFGLGAFVNRACVFGAIARFGSGEWAYIVTPVGFYLGCLAVVALIAPSPPPGLDAGSLVFAAPGVVAWLVAAFFAWRIAVPLIRHRNVLRELLTRHLWSPHAADHRHRRHLPLHDVAGGRMGLHRRPRGPGLAAWRTAWARAPCCSCACWPARMIGGWTAGRFKHTRISVASLLRCVAGGMLMGGGSLLIPGGNDGLILVGMPLLWPYAWVAFATMCIAIAGASTLQRRFTRGGAPPASTI